jgi:hypothetical protein
VLFINDLLKDKGTFMSLDEFVEMYKVKTNYLEYNGIIRAIQSNFCIFKFTGSKVAAPFRPRNMELLYKQSKGCKTFYEAFVESKQKNKTNKWQTEFEMQNDTWKEVCFLNFKFSTDTKLRWFQYRINQKILGTNTLLLKMNIKDDDSCTFCNTYPETIRHLFVDCRVSMKFWFDFKNWIKDRTNLTLTMSPKLIILGQNTT